MKYYAVGEINVTEFDWIQEYAENVTKIVESVGGKYLARTSEAETQEGDDQLPTISLIIEFPSKEAALKFYTSDEYAPYLKARQNGSTGKLVLVAGKDDANQATTF